MKIRNVECTGLNELLEYMSEYNDGLRTEEFNEMLKSINLTFTAEGINRFQSMLLCENFDSYVQQSQRYVVAGQTNIDIKSLNCDNIKNIESLITKAFTIYNKMSELTDEIKKKKAAGEKVGRPNISHYKYGIPIEDARYILPLAVTTNVQVSMPMDKFKELMTILFRNNERTLSAELSRMLLSIFGKEICDFCINWIIPINNTANDFYNTKYFNKIDDENNVVFFESFKDIDNNVARGALTSTMGSCPDEYIKKPTITRTIENVLSYGHTGIKEQGRYTFGYMMSMTCAHQFMRHRIHTLIRESFMDVIKDVNRKPVVPQTIKDSIFYNEYIELAKEFRTFRYNLVCNKNTFNVETLLLNCDQVKYVETVNARADEWVMRERTCMTAAWEIRGLMMKKLKILKNMSELLFETAAPTCILTGKCKEGGMCCGHMKDVQKAFKKLRISEK